MIPPIDQTHLKQVCQPGTEECCAYLIVGAEGFECGKPYPVFKGQIDLRLAEGTMRATGDNCPGYGEPQRCDACLGMGDLEAEIADDGHVYDTTCEDCDGTGMKKEESR